MPSEGAPALHGWTWRRVPNPVARGVLAAAVTASAGFALHVGGWGLIGRLSWPVALSGFLVALPVALTVGFLAVPPVLRRLALRGRLTRRRTIRLGAWVYGGIAFLWMAALRIGPPPEIADALGLVPGRTFDDLAVGLYRHVATPVAFAVYGAAAAWLGWRAAFGRTAAVSPFALTPAGSGPAPG